MAYQILCFAFYQIETPGGIIANINQNPWGLNVALYIRGQDYEKTEGLCGTYDSDKDNDLLPQGAAQSVDPSNPKQVEDFVQSWRLVIKLIGLCSPSQGWRW